MDEQPHFSVESPLMIKGSSKNKCDRNVKLKTPLTMSDKNISHSRSPAFSAEGPLIKRKFRIEKSDAPDAEPNPNTLQ